MEYHSSDGIVYDLDRARHAAPPPPSRKGRGDSAHVIKSPIWISLVAL